MKAHAFYLTCLFISQVMHVLAANNETLLSEQFTDLSQWSDFKFPDQAALTQYSVEQVADASWLKIESNDSVSAIIHQTEIKVTEDTQIAWKWKVKNILQKGDITQKKYDDFPIRIAVVFTFDPEQAAASERRWFKLKKLIYGKYPPHSMLQYVWANKKHSEEFYPSTYDKRTRIIIKQSGKDLLEHWLTETSNIFEDYTKAFGQEPPEKAHIAIMADTDNTSESSTAYVDWIEFSETLKELE